MRYSVQNLTLLTCVTTASNTSPLNGRNTIALYFTGYTTKPLPGCIRPAPMLSIVVTAITKPYLHNTQSVAVTQDTSTIPLLWILSSHAYSLLHRIKWLLPGTVIALSQNAQTAVGYGYLQQLWIQPWSQYVIRTFRVSRTNIYIWHNDRQTKK